MKIGYILFIFSLIFQSVFADTARNICDPSATSVRLVSDWRVAPNDQDRDLCASAECVVGGQTIPREKCIRPQVKGRENTVRVSYSDWVREGNVSRSVGGAYNITINKEDQCFSVCNPRGTKHRPCLECFKNRTDTVYDESINYPEIGRKLFKGTKCYELCKDPEGPIQATRTLSSQCQSCVGLNSLVPESFEYMLNKRNQCFEVESNRRYRITDRSVCDNKSDLILTEYSHEQTFAQMLTGHKGNCFEIDSKTFGSIFRVFTEAENCTEPTMNFINNNDRNLIEDRDRSAPGNNSNRAGSSRQ